MLRVAVGTVQIHCCFACLNATPFCDTAVAQSAGALGAVLLLVGLWTPVAGILVAISEAWIALSLPTSAEFPAILAVLGASLALIGPGAWSVDACIFGRKRIDPADL
jgi:putative oxidoreductase